MNILDLVGNTPLLKLSSLSGVREDVNVYAKAEFLNPSGSVKDRAAKAMILKGIQSGQLTKDKIIIDATSGSTGIAYAMIGAVLGYRVRLCLPANVSFERKNSIKAYGAEIIETSPLEGADGAYEKAQQMVRENPSLYFYPNQYNNNANWQAHYDTTAVEIWEQTNHKVTHFVAGAGTSGTFMGTGRRLKQFNLGIQAVLMQPDSPFHGIEGMKHMASTINPGIFDSSFADDQIDIATEEAYRMTKELAAKEGIFAGISSGANVSAALKLAQTVPAGSCIVTVLCDGGYRYLTEPIWEEL